MKMRIELEGGFGDEFAFKSDNPKIDVIVLEKRFHSMIFTLRYKTDKGSTVCLRFKIDEMLYLSLDANNQFFEIMLMHFIFRLLDA
ncbi:hypothetical protein D3C71_1601120 [compost metagenome]